jgi:hypothetical protein
MVTDITIGKYTLKIVTRYTPGAVLLNNPRIIVYELPIKVS